MNPGAEVSLVGLVHRSRHHAAASGYPRLAEFIPGMVTVSGEGSRVPYRIRKVVASRLPGRGRNYDSSSLGKELQLLSSFRDARGGVAHYFDAERDACVGPLFAHRFGWATAGSFHYPPTILREVISSRAVNRLDAAVALASNQVELLAGMVGPDRVRLIPLGVDTDFFHVPSQPHRRDRFHVLLVGQHLRDFSTFAGVVDELKRRHGTLRVTAVLLPAYHRMLPERTWVTPLSGIDDQHLRSLYRSASCLLLPLSDAAACTALLEAMACGMPVVTTNVGGTLDYVPDGVGFRCQPGEAEMMADAVSAVLLAEPDDFAHMEEASRANALRFSLPVVARQLEGLLESLTR